VYYYNCAQFLFIFPFLQTNITSQMWPTGSKLSNGTTFNDLE